MTSRQMIPKKVITICNVIEILQLFKAGMEINRISKYTGVSIWKCNRIIVKDYNKKNIIDGFQVYESKLNYL